MNEHTTAARANGTTTQDVSTHRMQRAGNFGRPTTIKKSATTSLTAAVLIATVLSAVIVAPLLSVGAVAGVVGVTITRFLTERYEPSGELESTPAEETAPLA